MLKIFEEFKIEDPKINEIFIIDIGVIKKQLMIKIMTKPINSTIFPHSYRLETYDLVNGYEYDIYYNHHDKYFFYSLGDICKTLFRSFNKDEAFDYLNLIKNSKKFNL